MNYYIQGNKEKADQIKAAFEKLGYNTGYFGFTSGQLYYTVEGKVELMCTKSLQNLIKTHPDYKELELPIEPCFKVGDKIDATIYGIKRRVTIRAVDKTNRCYFGTLAECIGFSEQDQWHLAPKPHYNITNFHAGMPVLVRWYNTGRWRYSLYSFYEEDSISPFDTVKGSFTQCIPFEGNEHLLGTTDMPDEMYINW